MHRQPRHQPNHRTPDGLGRAAGPANQAGAILQPLPEERSAEKRIAGVRRNAFLSAPAPAEQPAKDTKRCAQKEPESESEAALFRLHGRRTGGVTRKRRVRSRDAGKLFAGKRVRRGVRGAGGRAPNPASLDRSSIASGARGRELAEPSSPAPLPQAVAQHDSFGQEGDEYKLPAPGNIPDATTDPSQIRVVPVIDPDGENGERSGCERRAAQATAGDNYCRPGQTIKHPDQSQAGPNQAGQNQAGQNQAGPIKLDKTRAHRPGKICLRTRVRRPPGPCRKVQQEHRPRAALPVAPVRPTAPAGPTAPSQPRSVASSVPSVAPPHAVSTGSARHSFEPEIADGFHDSGCQREQTGRGGHVID